MYTFCQNSSPAILKAGLKAGTVIALILSTLKNSAEQALLVSYLMSR